jgi:uroporphyrin-III C-methyltransferase / precorrin-2 dehydrogenase / sirohydrochlorin ferrochelatase
VRYFPAFLDLQGRRCVVLGGGAEAAEKAAGLLEAGARVTVIAPDPNQALADLAGDHRVDLEVRPYRRGDLAGARLAVDATGDDATNEASCAEAEERGVLHNVVDRPQRCGFIYPAVVRRDPLLVAISTSGESPYLAGALRAHLERLLGREWSAFTALVGRTRRVLRERGVSLDHQNRVYRALLASPARRLLRDGATAEAQELAGELATRAIPGRVALVGAGPGDPALLTLAAAEALSTADAVLHDALVSPEVLDLVGPQAELIDVGVRAGRRRRAQHDTTSRLIELARAGRFVVRLKGGDPFVFGRGGEELAALLEAGIDVSVVPGVSAAVAAPALAGIPLTHRDIASSVAFVTGHAGAEATPPAGLGDLARVADTLVVLMPLGNLEALAGELMTALGPERPAALVASASLPGQQVVRAPLHEIPRAAHEHAVSSPAILVVGDVVDAPAEPPGQTLEVALASPGAPGG